MSATAPDNFLGLDAKRSNYDRARFAVLPVPYDATTSFVNGTRFGPRAIITASQQVETYDECLGRDVADAGITTLEPVEPDARGPEHMIERIRAAAQTVVDDGKFLVGLGGEHSITAGLVAAVHTAHKSLSVLQIDAHADLRATYQGSPYSHACVMRRIAEMNVPAVGVGIRNYSAEEADFIRARTKPILTARDCHTRDDWIQTALGHLTPYVYVTIDIDGFDPAVAPGTGTPEPGGVNWYQVTQLLEALAQSHQVVGADCVEVRPQPGSAVTEFLAAKLMYRLMGLVHAG